MVFVLEGGSGFLDVLGGWFGLPPSEGLGVHELMVNVWVFLVELVHQTFGVFEAEVFGPSTGSSVYL